MDHAERAARLEKWLHSFGSKGALNTTVADPKPARSGGVSAAVFGPTTLFTVTTECQDDMRRDMWTAERSMSDFVALRAALVQRFPGAVMGHLPESKVTDLTKSKEEKKTKQGEILNHFLRFLCRHPFISQDQVFLAFLSVSSKFSDALKAVAPASAPTGKFKLNKMLSSSARNKRKSLERDVAVAISDEPQSAPDWWREAIDLAAEPGDPLKLSKDVLSELDRIKKRISDLKGTIRDFREKLKEVGGTCLELHKSFQAWLTVEYSPDAVSVQATDGTSIADPAAATTITTSEAGGEDVMVNMSMPVLLAENSVRFEKQGLLHQRMALDSTATLLSAVREEILVLDAMKEEVTAARDSVIRVEEAKAYLQKKDRELQFAEEQARAERGVGSVQGGSEATFAYEDAGDPNFERKTRPARKAREDAIMTLETATAVASTLTRSTLNLELNFFREERIIRSDKFFTEFARVHSEYSAKSLEIWTMRAIHGLPAPPVNLSVSMPQMPEVKNRVGRLETARSIMFKSGIYDSEENEAELKAGASSSKSLLSAQDTEEDSYTNGYPETVHEELLEWGLDIPWDPQVARPVQVVFDFHPEHDDELEGKEGDRGTAVPFDEDRQWLHVKLTNGRSGIIPVDFVRIIKAAVKPATTASRKHVRSSSLTEGSVTEEVQQELEQKLREMEQEMNRMRTEYDVLRKEAKEREEYMSSRANELANANQLIAQLKSTNKNLQLELETVTGERDRALAERDRLARVQSSSEHIVRAQPAPSTSASSSPAQDDDQLPPNWVRGFDKARNRYFYHNTVTKESVWKRPGGGDSKAGGSKRKQGDQ